VPDKHFAAGSGPNPTSAIARHRSNTDHPATAGRSTQQDSGRRQTVAVNITPCEIIDVGHRHAAATACAPGGVQSLLQQGRHRLTTGKKAGDNPVP